MKTEALIEELECAKANLRLVIKEAPRMKKAEVECSLECAADFIDQAIAVLGRRNLR